MAQHEIDSGGGTSEGDTSERDTSEGYTSDEDPTKKAKLSKSSDTRKIQVLMSLYLAILSLITRRALQSSPTCPPVGCLAWCVNNSNALFGGHYKQWIQGPEDGGPMQGPQTQVCYFPLSTI